MRKPLTISEEEYEEMQEQEEELEQPQSTLPPQKDVRKRDYKIENFTITPANVGNFEILPDRRQISEGMVRQIHVALLSNKNPIGVLIINRKEGKDRLIDGNHRIEAVKRYFDYRKSAAVKIECSLKVFENLTPEEERQVYSDEANRRNESLDDKLNKFKSTLTIWDSLHDTLNPFPCNVTIYPTQTSIKLKLILNTIATARRKPGTEFRMETITRNNVIEFAQDIQYDEVLLMRDFITMFIKIFGVVDNNNVWIKPQFFIPLFDIYVRNIQYRDDPTFEERFHKILGRSDLKNYDNMVNRFAAEESRKIMLKYMNKGYSKKLFQ